MRDYYASISLFGIFVCVNGLYRLHGSPKFEVLGGGQIIIGTFLILFGLLFLHFGSCKPGFLDKAADRFIRKLGLG